MKSIKHIIGERNTVLMRALIQEVGIKGFGVYWYFVEELHEKSNLEVNEVFYDLYTVIFQLKAEELKKIISVLLKHKIFVLDGDKLNLAAILSIQKVRSEAGSKAMEKRWHGGGVIKNEGLPKKIVKVDKVWDDYVEKMPIETIKVIEPSEHHIKTVDKLEEIIKKAIAKKPIQNVKTEEIKKVKESTRKKTVVNQDPSEIKVSPQDFENLETMQIKQVLKDWEFLLMFNEIKLQYKPNSKGNQALSLTDKKNLKSLISAGYTKQDFEKAIHGQMLSKWVVENDMQVPSHILRNDNFVRYLEKSTYKNDGFKEQLTDEPVYK